MKLKIHNEVPDDDNILWKITDENNDYEYRCVIDPPEWTKSTPGITINIKSYDSKRVVKKKTKKAILGASD